MLIVNVKHSILNIFTVVVFQLNRWRSRIVVNGFAYLNRLIWTIRELTMSNYDISNLIDVKKETLVSRIKVYFVSGTKPARKPISWLENMKEQFDCSFQDEVLNATVYSPECKKYPLLISYTLDFLKGIINLLEEKNWEISENIYLAYTKLLSANNISNEYSYHTYILGPKTNVILKESVYFIAENTTGIHTWEASKCMTEWCIENREIFENKLVLELGCGVGLTGIIFSYICKPSEYIYTDGNQVVLEMLKENLSLNSSLLEGIPYNVQLLEWNTDEISHFSESIDWVIASDVTYDSTQHELLTETIKKLCPKEGTIVVSKERNPDTEKLFIKQLGISGLSFKKLKPPKLTLFNYSDLDTFELYNIFTDMPIVN